MPSIFKRILNLGKQTTNKVLDKYEDDLYALQRMLDEYLESKDKIKYSLLDLKASRELAKKEKDSTELLIAKLEEGAKKALLEGKESLSKEAFEKMQSQKSKLATYDKTLETYDDSIAKIEKQIESMDKKIKATKLKVSELEAKKKFTDSVSKLNSTVKEINSVLGGLEEGDNKHVQNIEKDYTISQMQLEDINSVDELQLLIEDTDADFEDFKKSLLNKEDNE